MCNLNQHDDYSKFLPYKTVAVSRNSYENLTSPLPL